MITLDSGYELAAYNLTMNGSSGMIYIQGMTTPRDAFSLQCEVRALFVSPPAKPCAHPTCSERLAQDDLDATTGIKATVTCEEQRIAEGSAH